MVATPSKLVEKLGTQPLPVEVVPFGAELTEKHLRELGGNPVLRVVDGTPFRTDNGNYIFDCSFSDLSQPKHLEEKLNLIPGVVENGLFIGMADMVISLNRQYDPIIIER